MTQILAEEFEINQPETSREVMNSLLTAVTVTERWNLAGRTRPRGLILPVEFSDFNPVESWADPKYLDAWQQKGWLKAGHTQP